MGKLMEVQERMSEREIQKYVQNLTQNVSSTLISFNPQLVMTNQPDGTKPNQFEPKK